MKMMTRAVSRRQLPTRVADFAAARRRATAARHAAWGLAIGGVLAFLVGAAFTFFGVDGGPVVAGFVALVAILVAAATGWLRQVPETLVALDIDRRLGLGERVTTALEMVRRDTNQPLVETQIADAMANLSRARPAMVYPLRLSRLAQALAVLGIALAILPWIVPWSSVPAIHAPAAQVEKASRSEADRLDNVANRLQSQKDAADQPTRSELATQLRQAADDLRQDGGTAQRASADLQRADQAVSSLAPRTGENAALTLARISDALNGQPSTQPVTRALDQQNVAQAAAAMNQLAANLSSMTPEQRQNLASALQAASDAARTSDTNASQQLQQAARAARSGDPSGVRQAAQALRQLGAASQAQRDVGQTSAELQASQQAIAQTAQAGSPQLSSVSNSASAASEGQSAEQNSSQSGGPGQAGPGSQPGQGNQTGAQNGDGIGKGSADHLGAANDAAGVAQREVTVPTGQQPDTSSVSASSQLQVGTAGQARVDYRNVLPQYQKQALQAIEGNAVPTGLKQVVKGYFDSLAAH